jgi:hypothetical protein
MVDWLVEVPIMERWKDWRKVYESTEHRRVWLTDWLRYWSAATEHKDKNEGDLTDWKGTGQGFIKVAGFGCWLDHREGETQKKSCWEGMCWTLEREVLRYSEQKSCDWLIDGRVPKDVNGHHKHRRKGLCGEGSLKVNSDFRSHQQQTNLNLFRCRYYTMAWLFSLYLPYINLGISRPGTCT